MKEVERVVPARPACFEYDSIASLYVQFEILFLSTGGTIVSSCGHTVMLFDHHFFHLAAVRTEHASRLFMAEEKAQIRATTEGFGKYLLEHKESRARNLPSAKETLSDPDEVWAGNPKATAKWIYIREFDSKPYAFTVVLLTDRPEEGGIIVPVSSFPCKRSDMKKWRQGILIHRKQKQSPEGD